MKLVVRIIVMFSLLAASIVVAGVGPIGSGGSIMVTVSAPAAHDDCSNHGGAPSQFAEAASCCAATALSCTGFTAKAEAWTFSAARMVDAAWIDLASVKRSGIAPEGVVRPPRG